MSTIASWLSGMFVSAEEEYLSRSVDLADFERRQRIVEREPKLAHYTTTCGINSYHMIMEKPRS